MAFAVEGVPGCNLECEGILSDTSCDADKASHFPSHWGRRNGHAISVKEHMLKDGFNPLALPENIWSALVLLYLTEGCHTPEAWFLGGSASLQLMFTVAIQGYSIRALSQFIETHDRNLAERCVVNDHWLCHVCLVVFLMLVVVDLKETFDMGRWISRFHIVDRWESLTLGRFSSVCCDIGTKARVDPTKPLSGITGLGRLAIALFILVPKAFVGVAMLYFGSAYVVTATDTESLLQNCVALVFILEIDNAVYTLLIPHHWKQLVTCIRERPIGLSNSEWDRSFSRTYQAFGLIGVPCCLFLALFGLEWRWCRSSYDAEVDSQRAVMVGLAMSALLAYLSLGRRLW